MFLCVCLKASPNLLSLFIPVQRKRERDKGEWEGEGRKEWDERQRTERTRVQENKKETGEQWNGDKFGKKGKRIQERLEGRKTRAHELDKKKGGGR